MLLRRGVKSVAEGLRRLTAVRLASTSAPDLVIRAAGDKGVYPGAETTFTNSLEFAPVPECLTTYRVMDEAGNLLNDDHHIPFDKDQLREMYRSMLAIRNLDNIFYDAQRQGRISFYMTSFGEEATHIGSAAALTNDDTIFAQYREMGVLLWRGFSIQQLADQLYSNCADLGKGRQMPVHYGSKELNFQTISSPLTTQLPQAAGAAYAKKRQGDDSIVVCYFGEGAASEGDFHAGMNFAATLDCPMIFFCRNNGFAISTPSSDQYRGDGIGGRGIGYGMKTIRCDGNDIFAVHEATALAKEYALEHKAPVLIEAMTYRGGHHSTSDDSTRYRPAAEIQAWNQQDNPITRFRAFLESREWWSDDDEQAAQADIKKSVMAAFRTAEKRPKPSLDDVFSDVYDTKPLHLQEQERELHEHLEKHGHAYKLDEYEASTQ